MPYVCKQERAKQAMRGTDRLKNINPYNILVNSGAFIKKKDIRSQPDDVLNKMVGSLELELSTERRKIASTGVSSKTGKSTSIRKTIARIKTVLKERGAKD